MATIDDLTNSTTALLAAVNVSKATLDAKVQQATDQATAAASNGAAQVALATVQAAAAQANANSVVAVNAASQTALAGTTSAATQAANARDQAISASQVATAGNENLAAIGKTFHTGAIVKSFLYDTSKDSDGGQWRKKMQSASWYNETIYGNWLGEAATELAARGDNLWSYQEELSNAVWAKTRNTPTDSYLTAPDGSKIARIDCNATSVNGYYVARSQVVAAGRSTCLLYQGKSRFWQLAGCQGLQLWRY
jgi:hypothetical protein